MSASRLFKPSPKPKHPDVDLFRSVLQILIQHDLELLSPLFEKLNDIYALLLTCKSLSESRYQPETRLLMQRLLERHKLALFRSQRHENLNRRLRYRIALRLVEDAKLIPITLFIVCGLMFASTLMLLCHPARLNRHQTRSLSRYDDFMTSIVDMHFVWPQMVAVSVIFAMGFVIRYLANGVLQDFNVETLQQLDAFVLELRAKIDDLEAIDTSPVLPLRASR